jgi:hypothetical protein
VHSLHAKRNIVNEVRYNTDSLYQEMILVGDDVDSLYVQKNRVNDS